MTLPVSKFYIFGINEKQAICGIRIGRETELLGDNPSKSLYVHYKSHTTQREIGFRQPRREAGE
jgi:hypothetical protein